MILLLLGAPGSGKGTISSKLIEKHNFKQISTGDLLRAEVKSGSKLGKQIDGIIKSGNFVSADLVNNLVKTYVNKYKKAKKNIVLDGYPRNIEQAKYLSTYTKVDKVVELVVVDKLLVKRIVGRWGCPQCGAGYNVNTSKDYLPIVKKGKYFCKKCGAELTQRKDDNIATVKNRLKVYKEQTFPLVKFYQKQKIVTTIDGNLGSEKIVSKIIKK